MLRSARQSISTVYKAFVRTKKNSTVSPSTQRVVNQLSALSASRKQPKLIRLCKEDLIKHRTITNAWKIYQRKKALKQNAQLEKQYNSIVGAMEDLKHTSPALFEMANQKERTRFPIEMRTPTDFPANKPWVYNYASKK